ncbi:uncharacterized protein LOC110900653 [Helianthus annuus]|uniref:uncharacterized protein LOC110900653 n=1 Tax=Helianthus annuus TaxID=4232 RepID=UPI000B8F6678|nr:uncharacterized protein LOC110900653 [Helianthus annuus]
MPTVVARSERAGYGASYVQEEYDNNFFNSGASGVQQDVDVFNYPWDNWLNTSRYKFVSAWTNQTNKTEGAHAALKKQLNTPKCSLETLEKKVDTLVLKQYMQIKKCLEESHTKRMNSHLEIPLFRNLLCKVSIHALNLLENELTRRLSTLRSFGSTCGCQLYTGCRLLCACCLERLQNTEHIQLDGIDIFWRKLDLNPPTFDDEEIDVEKEFEDVRQKMCTKPPQVKKSIISNINAVLNPFMSDKKPHVVQENTHGWPTSKVQQQRREQPAKLAQLGLSNKIGVTILDTALMYSCKIL